VLTLSRDDIRKIDRCAIEVLRIPGLILMENAGRNAADQIEDFLGGVSGKSVAVVAGGGNNGGDGFVVARHLAMRGASVATFLTAECDSISGDAETNLRAIYHLGHDVREMNCRDIEALSQELRRFDLVLRNSYITG